MTMDFGFSSCPHSRAGQRRQGFGPYNVSKSAVNTLGASLAAECTLRYPDKDIQVNVLVPGEARTEMNQGSTESPYAVVSMVLVLLSHPPGGPKRVLLQS